PESIALKGRLAGSQDAGRVFFVPYSHIDYFGYQNPLKESEFHEVFGSLELAGAAADAPPPAAAAAPAEPPEPAAVPQPDAARLRSPQPAGHQIDRAGKVSRPRAE